MKVFNWLKQSFEVNGKANGGLITAFLFVLVVMYRIIFSEIDPVILGLLLGFIAAAFGITAYQEKK